MPRDQFILAFPIWLAAVIALCFAVRLIVQRIYWLHDQPRPPRRRGGSQNGSFGWTAAAWLTIASTGASVVGAAQQRSASIKANNQARDNALATQAAADRANNRANAKTPDTAASLTSAMLAGKMGQSSTMLTGPQGVDQSQLTLGKNSLLGE